MIKPHYYPSLSKHELIDTAISWLKKDHKIALLTLVGVEGNAPYPIGTQMLVRGDGAFEGQITGGCVEAALAQQALNVIKEKQNITERYGLNSRFFDIKLPCGSGVDIEFNVQTTQEEYLSIADKLKQRKRVYTGDVKTYFPTPRLLVFGQGPIIDHLIELATRSGFDVLLFDYQQYYELQLYCDVDTGLVSLFHEHEAENAILSKAVTQPLFYIGALGSRKTHQLRLNKLTELGVSADQAKKIHAPIGVDINCQTPAQIAISIIAQAISTMNCNAV